MVPVGARSLVEGLPVAVRRLVGPRLGRRDRDVRLDAQLLHRRRQQVGVGVREQPDLPAAEHPIEESDRPIFPWTSGWSTHRDRVGRASHS